MVGRGFEEGEVGEGRRGVLWLLGPIAKKDMSCLLITQVHTGDNHLILGSSQIWSIAPNLRCPLPFTPPASWATGQTPQPRPREITNMC